MEGFVLYEKAIICYVKEIYDYMELEKHFSKKYSKENPK